MSVHTPVLYHPFEIEYREMVTFPGKSYRNNYFTLIYIIDGTGIQFVNHHRFNYRKGNLFLITPQDTFSFDITNPTKFFFLSFNTSYIKLNKDQDWVQRMDFILNNASHRPGCILKNKVDKPLIASLVENIVQEQNNQQLYHSKITETIVQTIILVVARNIALKLPKNIKENTGEAVLDILHYIQENIFTPDRLKVDEICAKLGISSSYLGKYFKKQTGETLQQYIINYKLRLVEMRLLHSDMRINEIVFELSYTDESHLNRLFKKYKGINPSEFRKVQSAIQQPDKYNKTDVS
ncbi:AraC family transcriptional regulator [Dyadobacter subterraneus]|uniref:Helix-turn-helix domain-containing protein n=1 Tax=Dyadobacter subterraneus TaxID=2773304 RepID=A0ABR9W7N1_9BACT|nr:AraC family transcriptional regulator [Dyadobacter subterraneus]MBE9461482.1 helix-turn-helix domain-containing protein [Dyadobacter subterraneus]